MGSILYINLPNIVSVLGVLPIYLLLLEGGYKYLIPLMIYNNIMDDLDGMLAIKLNLKSRFGAVLDNVCDVVTHTFFVLTVGMYYGGICGVASLLAVVGILLRVVSRLENLSQQGRGSPTNELIRHLLLLLLTAQILEFNPSLFLVSLFVLHTVSMLVPFPMPHLLRSRARSVTAISLVNLSLVVAWLVAPVTVIIAFCFLIAYLYSFMLSGFRWLKN
ncbi:MAG TPA: hypothetical protein EYQ50_28750 [Verrucomicrobiales bacterium]|nr:hypothetical protein [Verrucomicrobiales bacterium]